MNETFQKIVKAFSDFIQSIVDFFRGLVKDIRKYNDENT